MTPPKTNTKNIAQQVHIEFWDCALPWHLVFVLVFGHMPIKLCMPILPFIQLILPIIINKLPLQPQSTPLNIAQWDHIDFGNVLYLEIWFPCWHLDICQSYFVSLSFLQPTYPSRNNLWKIITIPTTKINTIKYCTTSTCWFWECALPWHLVSMLIFGHLPIILWTLKTMSSK